jgi:long-chain fatty acid transport protein
MEMRRGVALAGAAVAATLAAGPLQGQGSALDQHSACMSGRVGAGVAAPCDDGSAVYFNPAALADHGSVVGLGVTVVNAQFGFVHDPGTEPPPHLGSPSVKADEVTVPVPHGYVSWRVNPRMAAAIGLFAPYGLGLAWPVCPPENPRCGEPNFEGRFTGYDNSLRSVYVQPTVAYQVVPGRLNVGVGLDVVRATMDVSQRILGPAALGLGDAEIGDVRLSGDGIGFTGHVGATARLLPGTSVGVRYLHSARVDLSGDAEFTQVPTGNPLVDLTIGAMFPQDQGVDATVEFPAQLVAGLSHRLFEGMTVFADYQRSFWARSFDELEVRFAVEDPDTLVFNYRDANTFRFAFDYRALDALSVRGGIRYNDAATPAASPFLPEGERNYYTVGLGWRVTPRITADAAYQYIVQPPRAGPVRPGGPRAGVYDAGGQTFGLTLAYRFGGPLQ